MTPRRARFALIVTVIIAVAALASMFLGRGGDSSPSAGPFLTADDFPSGYQVSPLPNTAPPGIGGTTMPAECGPVISAQAARQLRSSPVGVLAVPSDSAKPTFAQSVITGGESVPDTVGVVRQCPSYRQQTDTESFESTSSIVPAPDGCPRDAVVVRARTRYRDPGDQSDSTSVTAYVQGRNVVGVITTALNQPEAALSDEFCTLVSLAAGRLR
ncbi:hypothetical protein [Williamsia sp. M5A3_1d]